MSRILRLHEDYSPPPDSPHTITISKIDLLREISPSTASPVQVKVLGSEPNTLPIHIPQALVYEATPGLYRAKQKSELEHHPSISEGEIVRVTHTSISELALQLPYPRIPRGSWGVRLLDRNEQLTCCDPAILEPVDEPDEEIRAASDRLWAVLRMGPISQQDRGDAEVILEDGDHCGLDGDVFGGFDDDGFVCPVRAVDAGISLMGEDRLEESEELEVGLSASGGDGTIGTSGEFEGLENIAHDEGHEDRLLGQSRTEEPAPPPYDIQQQTKEKEQHSRAVEE